MGYSLFASRKLYYCSLINRINMQLDEIMQQRMNLMDFSAIISDGVITPEEVVSSPSIMNNISKYLIDYDNFIQSPGLKESLGALTAVSEKVGGNPTTDQINNLRLEFSLREHFAKQYSKQVAAYENKLDLQQKKLETELTAAQKHLEAVEQAEGQAIQAATPKFTGLA